MMPQFKYLAILLEFKANNILRISYISLAGVRDSLDLLVVYLCNTQRK